jgi:hypothetical protein
MSMMRLGSQGGRVWGRCNTPPPQSPLQHRAVRARTYARTHARDQQMWIFQCHMQGISPLAHACVRVHGSSKHTACSRVRTANPPRANIHVRAREHRDSTRRSGRESESGATCTLLQHQQLYPSVSKGQQIKVIPLTVQSNIVDFMDILALKYF